jgi:hypothetical protein
MKGDLKVAVCFSGLPMFIKRHESYWLSFIDEHKADVYASLWDDEIIYEDGDSVEYFVNTFKPVSIELEKSQAFYKSFRFPGEEYAANPQIHDTYNPKQSEVDFLIHNSGRDYAVQYKIWRANMLAILAEKEYDVVVRAETCSSYPNMEIVKENNISMPTYFVYHEASIDITSGTNIESKYYKQLALWPHLAFGPPDLMTYFCSSFLYLRKYFDESVVFPGEAVTNYHLSRRPDIQLRLFYNEIWRKKQQKWSLDHIAKETDSKELPLYYVQSGSLTQGLASLSAEFGGSLESSIKKLNPEECFLHKMHSTLPFKPDKDAITGNRAESTKKEWAISIHGEDIDA